MYLYI
ncbi:hypothetical protein E2C01_051142 [Portunus trituberculatus]